MEPRRARAGHSPARRSQATSDGYGGVLAVTIRDFAATAEAELAPASDGPAASVLNGPRELVEAALRRAPLPEEERLIPVRIRCSTSIPRQLGLGGGWERNR